MSSRLSRLESEAGLEIPALRQIYTVTAERLDRRRERLLQLDLPDELSVVFVGSWGRHEVTGLSDNDYYFVTWTNEPLELDGLDAAVTEALIDEEADFNGGEHAHFRAPGREGIFGGSIDVATLTTKIGLDRDTNKTLTQRMLLVLESVSIHNPELHVQARATIIDNYLDLPVKPYQPPRLFLNDVVRYWRTMCVDFAGKMRDRDGQGWGLRNAKLRATRKMLFASGLVPLLLCAQQDADAIPGFLKDQYSMTPTDRVADAFVSLAQFDAARRVFEAYEAFFVELANEALRQELDGIKSRAAADKSDVFQRVARLGDEIEGGLLDLLFSPDLQAIARKYAIF